VYKVIIEIIWYCTPWFHQYHDKYNGFADDWYYVGVDGHVRVNAKYTRSTAWSDYNTGFDYAYITYNRTAYEYYRKYIWYCISIEYNSGYQKDSYDTNHEQSNRGMILWNHKPIFTNGTNPNDVEGDYTTILERQVYTDVKGYYTARYRNYILYGIV